jgi:hypothetical protein
VVVGQILYGLGLIEQLYATLYQRLLHLGNLLEEPVG